MMTACETLKDKFERGVELVRLGSPAVTVATQLGVTAAALRSACLQAGVYIPASPRPRRAPGVVYTQRRREIVRAYLRNDPLDEICRRAGVTARGAARILQRELGVSVELPPQKNRRSKRGPTLRQQKAQIAAREVLRLRASGKDISLAQAARNYQLDRQVLRGAIRLLKKESETA